MNISLLETQDIARELRAAGSSGAVELFLTPAGEQPMARFTVFSKGEGGASNIRFGQAQYSEAHFVEKWVMLRTHHGKVESMRDIGRVLDYIENAKRYHSVKPDFELDEFWNMKISGVELKNGPDGYFLATP